MLVLTRLVISDLYIFHLIALLKAVFNGSNSFLSSSVDKVTTSVYSLVSVISSVTFVEAGVSGLAGLSPCVETAACNISQNTVSRPC